MTLIRRRDTRTFLGREGGWTADVQKAWRFREYSDAVEAVQRFRLQDVELYYPIYDGRTSEWDFTLPPALSLHRSANLVQSDSEPRAGVPDNGRARARG